MTPLTTCKSVREMAAAEGVKPQQLAASCADLCERGLLTLMRGAPGTADAHYALTYLDLDNPSQYSLEALARYRRNRAKLGLP